MKMKRLIPFILLSTVTLFAQSGDELFHNNCASCHQIIYGISDNCGYGHKFIANGPYITDLIAKLKKETASKEEFALFIKEYLKNPSELKSLYGKRAIKEFGLMPPLEGAMSEEEVNVLVNYLYDEGYKTPEVIQAIKVVQKQDPRKTLFNKHCASCHATILGVYNDGGQENKLITPAPYVTDLVSKLKEQTASKEEFTLFIREYIQNPSKRKSLYGKRAIKEFGLMPSLEGTMTDEEINSLAEYLYETQKRNRNR